MQKRTGRLLPTNDHSSMQAYQEETALGAQVGVLPRLFQEVVSQAKASESDNIPVELEEDNPKAALHRLEPLATRAYCLSPAAASRA